jgi:crotonobetainyl-CoA:carnitine CoA-transferase CaiB-like acyl-CoA transferase
VSDIMQGIRILEVAEHTFVPAASAVLADWGADVIKIEHVERGDAMRGLASSGIMNFGNGVHVLLEHSNRGKRSFALDLSQPEGLELLYKLAEQSDVFLTNKMEGVRKRLKIDVEDIQAHNPNIIYARGTGYGAKGPDADKGGYDMLAFWARSGNAVGASPPDLDYIAMQPGPGYGDSLGAMTIAGGIAAALLHRERTGEAKVVDVSLMGTGMWAMGAGIALSLQLDMPWQGTPVGGGRAGVRNPLTGLYRVKDNRWIALSCLQGFHYWPDMCRVIGRPELVDDERFNTVENLMANAPAAADILEEAFASGTYEEWKERLADFTGQWSPVQNNLEAVEDPQTVANDYVMETHTADGRPFKLVTAPVQFGEEAAPPKRGPDFNEHGDDILANELGLDDEAIVELKIKGVVA